MSVCYMINIFLFKVDCLWHWKK